MSFLETGGPGACWTLRGEGRARGGGPESRREAGLLRRRLRGREARAGLQRRGKMGGRAAGPRRVCWAPGVGVVWAHSVARAAAALPARGRCCLSPALDVRGLPHVTGGVGASSARVGRCCAGRPKVKKKLQRVLWRCQREESPSTLVLEHTEKLSHQDETESAPRWSSESCCGRAGSPADPGAGPHRGPGCSALWV